MKNTQNRSGLLASHGPHEKWLALKKRLIKAGLISPLFLQSADQMALAGLRAGQPRLVEHEPLLFDNLLRDAAGHLDRVLAYRREMRELEIQAVKAGAEYQLFKDQSKLDLALEQLRLRTPGKEILRDTHRKAGALFGEGPDAVAAGFGKISTGTAEQFDQELGDSGEEGRLLGLKFKQANDYQDAYAARHHEPGNAHNYGERAGQLAKLLGQDLGHAFMKSQAIYTGYRMIYGRKPNDLPDLLQVNFIDDLVLWLREIIDAVELEGENEVEYDLVVPLRQPTQKDANGTPLAPIVTEAAWARALEKIEKGKNPFEISFDLRSLFINASNLRVRRIGLAYGTKVFITGSDLDRPATYDAYAKYRAVIRTPLQSRPGARNSYRRPPVILGNMTVYGAPLAYSDGVECLNLNPLGSWSITVDPVPVYKSTESRTLQQGMMDPYGWLDLKLFLRIRARPTVRR